MVLTVEVTLVVMVVVRLKGRVLTVMVAMAAAMEVTYRGRARGAMQARCRGQVYTSWTR